MNPNTIKLYCSFCKKFLVFKRKQVKIQLDLEVDRIEFRAICSCCGDKIFNSRRWLV